VNSFNFRDSVFSEQGFTSLMQILAKPKTEAKAKAKTKTSTPELFHITGNTYVNFSFVFQVLFFEC